MKKELATDCDQDVDDANHNRFFPPQIGRNQIDGSSERIGIAINGRAQGKGQVVVAETSSSHITTRLLVRAKLKTLAQIGEDWLYLALLGIIMALISFSMDTIIALFLNTRLRLYQDLDDYSLAIQYVGWCLTPIVLVSFSSGFVHLCSPTAIGSGIPEMKTILRGVVLNEYLTFRTLIAKIVGLTFTLGSGLPLGKEGPSVHMASIVATLLGKLIASFQGIYENESRTSEMLSAACAVGVAATFYAPIGGVLFSIEVTTVYFAVKNYWRGFFAACCGATVWRLLGFWIKNDESISALFKTNFRTDYPFDPVELLVFSFIGASCGLAGAAYIKFHREIVQFFRRHKRLSEFLQQNRFVYPVLVTLIITTATFPPFLGKYTASTLNTHTTIEHLFSNQTWSSGIQDMTSKRILDEWTTPDTSFYLHLVLYIAMLFWTSALASTIPIPSGLFIPVLKMGAAYGRLLGELMHLAFPNGIKYGKYVHSTSIIPGSYAVVGAAAFSGAVTHTISTSVILFEMTGQIVHIIPVILGVLIANAVCQSLQPSIYDSIIEIKKLPYLPPIASSNSVSHKILVRDFMNRNFAYVWKKSCTYQDVKDLLAAHKKLISFPLVECSKSMKLLGSVPRSDLLKMLYLHLGRERRLQEVYRRNSDTNQPALHLMNSIRGRLADELKISVISNGGISTVNTGTSHKKSDIGGKANAEGSNSSTPNSSRSSSASSSPSSSPTPASGDEEDSPIAQPTSKLIPQSVPSITYGSTSDSTAHTTTIEDSPQPTEPTRKTSFVLDRDEIACRSQALSDESRGGEQKVAKMINHYDHGSLTDELGLSKSIKDVESNIEDMNQRVKDELSAVSRAPAAPPTKPLSQTLDTILLRPSDSPMGIRRPLSPLVESTPSYYLAANHHQSLAPSPSLSNRRPTKSILKTSSTATSLSNMYKRNMSNHSFNSSFGGSQYETGRANLLSMGNNNINNNNKRVAANPHHQKVSIMMGDDMSPLHLDPVRRRRKVRLPRLRVVDMTPEEQEQWEKEQLSSNINISVCQIDEAPFQLVEQTSLYRVHTLFSMLGLNHAYVTSFGKLVGVVALKDIRKAIEKMLQE